MIEREWKDCAIISYDDTIDAFGQIRKGQVSETQSKCVMKPFSHTNIDNPIFLDATHILLFRPSVGIELTDQIKIGNRLFNILYLQKDRYTQVFVK